MKKNDPPALWQHLRPSDLRGVARLATQATRGVTRMVEGVHQSVWSTLGMPGGAEPGQTRGITGMVYRSIDGVTDWVGKGLEAVLAGLVPFLEPAGSSQTGSPQREAVLAILNGVVGDHLVASGNPLATGMSLRHQGQPFHWDVEPHPAHLAGAGGKVLILIHGLCMNELQWHAEADGAAVDHGQMLADTLGYTPVYVRYNTGLHTSQNGHALAAELEQLLLHWPVPVEEITVLVHSMGGLVIRSAVHYACRDGLAWPGVLRNIVFLGTPHHGSPLERAGSWADTLLASTPFTAPLARLGHVRSAGITDLRWGNVLDDDWQGHDRFRRKPDTRQPLPLPDGVTCYAVAATLAAERGALAERLTGDGLVPLDSALGHHEDPQRRLQFAPGRQHVFYRMGHMELLSRPEVGRQVLQWLQAPVAPAA